jgi:glycosyltransferase
VQISVITVVRNGAHCIRNCVESVAGQSVPAEHIVVDGNSTDGTLDVLAKLKTSHPRLSFISEPDRGIYDAMSKGIQRARGDVVGCLNADDFYASTRTLERVVEAFADPATDTCYGDLAYVRGEDHGDVEHGTNGPKDSPPHEFQLPNERVIRYWRAGAISSKAFYWGWMPPHPTFFVRRSVYDKYGLFRLDLGTAADYELMLRFLVKHGVRTRYIPHLMVKMLVGGVSNASWQNRWEANKNDRKAWSVNGLRPYPWTLMLKPLRKIRQFTLGR